MPAPTVSSGQDSYVHQDLTGYYDGLAAEWASKKNQYYFQGLVRLLKFLVPRGSRVLEIGCANGDLLAAVDPGYGVGIDLSSRMLEVARSRHPHLRFFQMDAHRLTPEPELAEPFDYIILSDLVGDLYDVQGALQQLGKLCHPRTRIIITFYNFLWEPVLKAAERAGLKTRQNLQNWLSPQDLANLLDLSGFEVIKQGRRMPFPLYVPLVSEILNSVLQILPLLRRLGLQQYLVARPKPGGARPRYSCSVIVPCRNERGNIEPAVKRIPSMGEHTEVIFVEGNSSDSTLEEIQSVMSRYQGPHELKLIEQGAGLGKGDAVRKGFAAATGDVLMILDADLTVAPEDLPRFFDAVESGAGEFVNGCRLVYPMEKEAMRYLNLLGNKFFGKMFTWILDQPIKDTLCGTKVLLREDYAKIAANRTYFGNFDPFGDFDLLFGAAKLHLKIVEIPVRYRDRAYGSTNISRFRHGLLLLRMCVFAARKFKFF
ncbi:MAG TPA: glycosyltransferase [Bryobacterales bacterium]|jgi:SAM-dependent methyltransferase|nr:glycosyltransferase [Bryobacterales bacterium]